MASWRYLGEEKTWSFSNKMAQFLALTSDLVSASSKDIL
jgi:hypothetical protein